MMNATSRINDKLRYLAGSGSVVKKQLTDYPFIEKLKSGPLDSFALLKVAGILQARGVYTPLWGAQTM